MYGSVWNRVRVLGSKGRVYITISTHPLRVGGVPSFYLKKHSSVIDTDHLNSTTFVGLHCYYSIIIRNLQKKKKKEIIQVKIVTIMTQIISVHLL